MSKKNQITGKRKRKKWKPGGMARAALVAISHEWVHLPDQAAHKWFIHEGGAVMVCAVKHATNHQAATEVAALMVNIYRNLDKFVKLLNAARAQVGFQTQR